MGRTSGGSGGAVTLISSQVLAAPAANITFSAIPATYNHLRLVALLRSVYAAEDDTLSIRVNGVITNVYTYAELQALVSAVTANPENDNSALYVPIAAASSYGPTASQLTVEIAGYTLTTFNKVLQVFTGYADPSYPAAGVLVASQVGVANGSEAAVTSLALSLASGSNFATGSAAWLYGVT